MGHLMLWIIVIAAFFVLVLAPLSLWFLYEAAKHKQQATFVQENTLEYVYEGKDLREILVNSDRYKLIDADGPGGKKLVPKTLAELEIDKFLRRWFWKRWFGLYWVSIAYPVVRIHKFPIRKMRLKTLTKGADQKLDDMIEEEKPVLVDHLRIDMIRPFRCYNVELKDGSKVNFLLQGRLRVIWPYVPVPQLDGKFFEDVDAAVKSALTNFVQKKDYDGVVEMEKGPDSHFMKAILAVNNDNGPGKEGIIHNVGLELYFPQFIELELSEADEDLRQSMKEEEIAKNKGRADVATAAAKAEAAVHLAVADTATFRKKTEILNSMSKDALQAMTEIEVAANLAGEKSKINVLSMGGPGVQPTYQVNPGGGGGNPDSPPSGNRPRNSGPRSRI